VCARTRERVRARERARARERPRPVSPRQRDGPRIRVGGEGERVDMSYMRNWRELLIWR